LSTTSDMSIVILNFSILNFLSQRLFSARFSRRVEGETPSGQPAGCRRYGAFLNLTAT
jgi:hypothetical protein